MLYFRESCQIFYAYHFEATLTVTLSVLLSFHFISRSELLPPLNVLLFMQQMCQLYYLRGVINP